MLAATTLLLALLLPPEEIAVYVFTATDASGFTDDFQARRVESLRNLKAAIDKKKGFVLVDTAEAADITLEVVNAGQLETGNTRTKGLSTGLDGAIFGTTSKAEKKPQVHAMLRAGSYSMEFQGVGTNLKNAADMVAKAVEKWAKQNEKQLAAKRQ